MHTAKSTLKATFIVSLLTVISKAMGMVKDTLIAAKFGASYFSDVYFFAFHINNVLFAGIGAAISTTFIPLLTEQMVSKSREERNDFVNNVLTITFLLMFVISIFCMAAAEWITRIFVPGFASQYSQAEFDMAVRVLRAMLVSLVFTGVQSVLTGVLQCHRLFTVPAFIGIVFNSIVISYLVFWAHDYGVYGLTASVVIGFFLQGAIHIPHYLRLGYSYRFVFDLKDPMLARMAALMVPVFISTSISQIHHLFDYMLATTAGAGSLSIMNFASKLNFLVYSIYGMAVSTVIYPQFSKLSVVSDIENYKTELIKSVNVINYIMIPATIGMIVLRMPIINILFKRGAFDNNAAALTAEVLMFYAPGMLVYGLRDILSKAFYSLKNKRTPMFNSLISLMINIILNLLLLKFMGISGLALATSASYISTVVLLIFQFSKTIKGVTFEIMKSFCKMLCAAVIMGIAVHFINNFLACVTNELFSFFVSVLSGCLFYFGITFEMKLIPADIVLPKKRLSAFVGEKI